MYRCPYTKIVCQVSYFPEASSPVALGPRNQPRCVRIAIFESEQAIQAGADEALTSSAAPVRRTGIAKMGLGAGTSQILRRHREPRSGVAIHRNVGRRMVLRIGASPFGIVAMTERGYPTRAFRRPGFRPQDLDRIDSAPGFPLDLDLDRADAAPDAGGRRSRADRHPKFAALDARPENRRQGFDNIESAPGFPTDLDPDGADAAPDAGGRRSRADRHPKFAALDARPEIRPQGFDNIKSAPGFPTDLDLDRADAAPDAGGRRSRADRHPKFAALDTRPEIRPQGFDNIESAPGFPTDLDPDGADAAPDAGGGRSRADRHPKFAAPDARPENRPQGFDNIESAPGFPTDLDLDRADAAPDAGGRRSRADRRQASPISPEKSPATS